MTSPFKFLSQAEVVVNFSIEDNPKITRLVADGLMACGKVNDGKPGHTQCPPRAAVDSLVIGSPMEETLIHALNQGKIFFPKDAVDSTHRGQEISDSLGQGLGLLFWQLFSSHKA